MGCHKNKIINDITIISTKHIRTIMRWSMIWTSDVTAVATQKSEMYKIIRNIHRVDGCVGWQLRRSPHFLHVVYNTLTLGHSIHVSYFYVDIWKSQIIHGHILGHIYYFREAKSWGKSSSLFVLFPYLTLHRQVLNKFTPNASATAADSTQQKTFSPC